MIFQEVLNNYIKELKISASDISKVSGISPSTISRYRTGTRTPDEDSSELRAICEAIFVLSNGKLTRENIHETFIDSLPYESRKYPDFSRNFGNLIDGLNINIKELSEYTHFDPSYLSRLKNGTRNPASPGALINGISQFILDKKWDDYHKQRLSEITNYDLAAINSDLTGSLSRFLMESKANIENTVTEFVEKLNDFNLDDYIKEIHFDELKVPTVPFSIPTTRTYDGLDKMKQGELDFLKATALSRSKEPFTMYSNMPMADMAKDLDFGKKWMFGIAACIKKGLHLNMIHNLDRPFEEMMLGLLSWIPIYMTGQVSPYYFKNPPTGPICELYYSSGAAILTGECVKGNHKDGRYTLSTKASDIAYGENRGKHLLHKASPLMDIYTYEQKKEYKAFYNSLTEDQIKNLTVIDTSAFSNIKIEVLPGEFAIVTKSKSPSIRFVIRHSKLVNAIYNFKSPLS